MMTGMSHLYGDSTAFPYTVDFLDLVRAAVHVEVAQVTPIHLRLLTWRRLKPANRRRASAVRQE